MTRNGSPAKGPARTDIPPVQQQKVGHVDPVDVPEDTLQTVQSSQTRKTDSTESTVQSNTPGSSLPAASTVIGCLCGAAVLGLGWMTSHLWWPSSGSSPAEKSTLDTKSSSLPKKALTGICSAAFLATACAVAKHCAKTKALLDADGVEPDAKSSSARRKTSNDDEIPTTVIVICVVGCLVGVLGLVSVIVFYSKESNGNQPGAPDGGADILDMERV